MSDLADKKFETFLSNWALLQKVLAATDKKSVGFLQIHPVFTKARAFLAKLRVWEKDKNK